MALQTSIAEYFSSRKRRAVDEIKKVSNTNKVLILDKNETDVSDINEATSFDGEAAPTTKKIIYDSPKIVNVRRIINSAPKLTRKTPKSTSSHKKLQQKSNFKQCDIRKSLLASFNAQLNQSSEPSKNIADNKHNDDAPVATEKVNVPFEIKGSLSPKKTLKPVSNICDSFTVQLPNTPQKSAEIYSTPKKTTKESNLCSQADKPSSKDSISELRSKLIKSNRLDEIKNALKKLNEGHQKLKEIESKLPPKSPSLKKFKSVEIEFSSPTKSGRPLDSVRPRPPQSPSLLQRSLLMSPGKSESSRAQYISPRKLFTESSPVKAAAFERHSALVAKGKPSLILPFKYRTLAETFRAVDTVVSLLFNRNETINFTKLRASVQQMSKKNFSQAHLGQIHSVCSELFSFRQEKIRHAPGSADKYELVINPVIDSSQGENEVSDKVSSNTCLMTPSVLLERKRKLYLALLEKTKDYHQEFISTLDPPMIVDRQKLSRWHPEFDVDGVPDIPVYPLPQPPNVETFSSAKDVLSKARDMFICNPRMEKALERVSSDPQSNTLASASIPALKSALKGIPSSLLEKIRAKQAAKAAESLTRNPQSGKRKVELSRLPELARIVRNVFVGEKKNILPKTLLLTKLNDSFREVLTPSDLEHHLQLLMDCSSGWLTTLDCRKELFYKISKDTDLSKVLLDIQNAVNKL